MYDRGTGVEKDGKKAFELFLRSAAKGNAAALCNVRTPYLKICLPTLQPLRLDYFMKTAQ